MAAPVIDSVAAHVTAPVELSRRVQRLVMGIHDHDFIVGSDAIFIMKDSESGMKVNADLARLTEHRDSQRTAILLHDDNTMMLMRTSEMQPQTGCLNQLDVTRREIVSTWSFQKDGVGLKARSIGNDKKPPASTSGSSFFTLNDNRLSQWDIRARRGIVDVNAFRYVGGNQYASKHSFRCMAVDGHGDVALGTDDGVISHYTSGVLSRAKVKLPRLQGSIRNLDVTYDGSLVLATLDQELVLMCTSFVDKDGNSKSAFKNTSLNLKGSSREAPIVLKLTASDASIFLTGHTLHDGRFSWIGDKSESYIVASGGNCAYVWNLDRVADATHDCYKICSDLKL